MRRLLITLAGILALASSCAPPSRPQRPADPVSVVLWSSRDLPAGLDAKIAAVEGVKSVIRIQVGTLNLIEVSGASKPLPRRAPNGILPVTVGATDVSPTATDELSNALRAGEAALTQTAATLRGIAPGASVTIEGAGVRKTFRVGAVIPDAAGRQREIVLSTSSAQGLGLSAPRTLVTSVQAKAVGEAVRTMQSLTEGVPVRIQAPGHASDEEQDLSQGSVLSLAEIKSIFGEFTFRPVKAPFIEIDQAWEDANIVKVRVPILGLISCNAKIIPQLTGAMNELIARGLAGLVRSDSGCYSPRMQVGDGAALSRHTYGIAVDINAPTNRFGDPPAQDQRLVEVMERWGFTWGGRWLVPDGMHFEFVRFVTAADAVPPAGGVPPAGAVNAPAAAR